MLNTDESEENEMARFCTKCGTELIDGVCPKCINEENTLEKSNDDKFKNIFLSPNEKMVTVLGNSYFQNFLKMGTIDQGYVIVSDTRVYFRGTSYDIGDGGIIQLKQSQIVDLQDITGVGFDSGVDKSWIFLGIKNFLIGLVILIVYIVISTAMMRNSSGQILSYDILSKMVGAECTGIR